MIADLAGSDPLPYLERLLASNLIKKSNVRRDAPLERFLRRSPSELIISRHWSALNEIKIARPLTDAVTSGLISDIATERGEVIESTRSRSGTVVVFAKKIESKNWIRDINEAIDLPLTPYLRASYVFATTIINHPYRDGNGRLARALFQRSLGIDSLISGPILPLGPLIYNNQPLLIRAIIELGTSGDWLPFLRIMDQLLEKSALFSEFILSASRNKQD